MIPGIILGSLAALFLAGAVNSILNTVKFMRHSVFVEGTVIKLVPKATQGRRGRVYAPLVEFKTQDGTHHQFKAEVASNPPSYKVGDYVKVIYNPENPQEARIKNFEQLWLFPLVLVIFGGVMVMVSLLFFSRA